MNTSEKGLKYKNIIQFISKTILNHSPCPTPSVQMYCNNDNRIETMAQQINNILTADHVTVFYLFSYISFSINPQFKL
jgi:translation initiation factor 2 gamma subunit (eIF-2gamma)